MAGVRREESRVAHGDVVMLLLMVLRAYAGWLNVQYVVHVCATVGSPRAPIRRGGGGGDSMRALIRFTLFMRSRDTLLSAIH